MANQKLCTTIFALLVLMQPMQATASNEKLHLDCTTGSTPRTVISSCGALIKDDDDPDTIEIYTLRRADAYAELNQFTRAVQDYTAVLKLNTRVKALLGRGDIYFKTKNYNAAIADYRSVLQHSQSASVRKATQKKLKTAIAAK